MGEDRVLGAGDFTEETGVEFIRPAVHQTSDETNTSNETQPIYPRVFKVETLLSDFITVDRKAARNSSERRTTVALHVAKRAAVCSATQALKARAVASGVIPKILQYTQ